MVWSVYAYDMIDNLTVTSHPVTYYLDGNFISANTTDSSGRAIFRYTFLSSARGHHNVTFASPGDQVYDPAVSVQLLTVFTRTSLSLKGGTVILGQSNKFTLSLSDSQGNPVPGRIVRIEVSGSFLQNVTTDANGQANFTWRPSSTGNFTITARFLAASPGEFGYEPSTDMLTVNIKPATVLNTQGTQSLSFQTAQGIAQSNSLTFSIAFPALGLETLTAQLNGRTAVASSHLSNEFSWGCAASILGVCLLPAPVWKLHLDTSISSVLQTSVSSVLDSRITGDVFGGGLSDSLAYTAAATDTQAEVDAFSAGLHASTVAAVLGLATEAALGGYTDEGAVAAGGIVAGIGLIVAAGAGVGYGADHLDLFKAYEFGIWFAPLAAIACFIKYTFGVGICPEELFINLPIDLGLATSVWLLYMTVLYFSWLSRVEALAMMYAVTFLSIGFGLAGVLMALL
jgi:hypothetical protein